jgi:hypothetical protein
MHLRLLPPVLVGAYCWVASVWPAVPRGGSALTAQLLAGAAAVCLLAVPLVPRRFSLVVGLDAFVAACLGVWLLALARGEKLELGPPALLGWLAFTLAWGAVSKPQAAPEPERGPPLDARSQPGRLLPLLALSALLALPGLLLISPAPDRPLVAVLARLVALGVVLLGVGALARIAARQLLAGTAPHRLRAEAAPLALLALLLLLGLALGLRA